MLQSGSGMALGTSHQTDTSQQGNENASQWKTCQCEEGEGSLWSCKLNDDNEKHTTSVRCSNCQNLLVFKSGHMLISSKGLGWTSWKRRWFMLTRESLIFFRSDPNAPLPPQQRGNELNLYLDTIELNNSGSVVAKADKKLLTVNFPESRDGRTFTLKAETSEDLQEWKNVLDIAISQAPSPPVATGGQSTTSQNDETNDDGSQHSTKDKPSERLKVIGRPIAYALTEVDGNPAFLEKALTFIEEYGITVEGILRQSADVEEVLHRFDEYEKGRIEFSPDEDAHVIGDCIKYVLRELPSSPVPASCCTALVDALKGDRGSRVSNIRSVIFDIFPEPNRQLLQRTLEMMLIVASHKSENLMSLSAAAACMAPLLLRPLLAGECELKDEFQMGGGGDGSMQLLQAAAAANHAQTIVIIFLEHFDRIFTDLEDYSSETYSETEGSEEDDDYEDESVYSENEQEIGIHDELDNDSETDDESGSDAGSDGDGNDNKEINSRRLDHAISKVDRDSEANKNKGGQLARDTTSSSSIDSSTANTEINERQRLQPYEKKEVDKVKGLGSSKRSAIWGRTSAKKNLSIETSDCLNDDETSVLRLESTKSDLRAKLTNEVKENEVLKANLESRKETLRELQLLLQKEVERLKLLLEKERNLRTSLEAGLNSMQLKPPISDSVDSKTRKDLEDIANAETDITNLKQKVTDLKGQIDEQKQKKSDCLCASCGQQVYGNRQFNK